jgi:hypothetical protein
MKKWKFEKNSIYLMKKNSRKIEKNSRKIEKN